MSHETKIFGPFDNQRVLNFLPHRYPFLFVDKVLEVSVPMDAKGQLSQIGTKVVGIKNATINEPYFTGHFPGLPITPGVILIETMAQVSSFAMIPWLKVDADMRIQSSFELRLAGVDSCRFRRPVVPGDTLVVKCEVTKHRGPIWGFSCSAEIDGNVAVECEILASVSLEAKK
jgi:3-hydroxyacyl-[acyl-carrier-protein] dehydratase